MDSWEVLRERSWMGCLRGAMRVRGGALMGIAGVEKVGRGVTSGEV